jgi:nicotinate-nucleotide--dimethylbenzimidazole phosphoribosyltransferase
MADVMIDNKEIQAKIDFKTKPLGALGFLEQIAFQICRLQKTVSPVLIAPHIVVFASDHGIAMEGVSAYPQDVTWQMVYNFIQGGAAINVFSKQNDINLQVVDCGVNYEFPSQTPILHKKVARSTKSFLHEPAMNNAQYEMAFSNGASVLSDIHNTTNCNVIGFGEMGIGNTSAAALIMHCITGRSMEECVGRGTGVDDVRLQSKLDILRQAKKRVSIDKSDTAKIAQEFGGFEIVSMLGAMLKAKALGMMILVDGFIATSAFLLAHNIDKDILGHAIFCHQSDENGHKYMLDYLGVKPILNLGMRLGEGTGCAVAYPIIKSAVAFMNEMASFESANVSHQ